METLKAHFARSILRPGAPLHFAAHSHHPWPDVTEAAQRQCWEDAATLLDGKWQKVFGEVVPAAQRHVARQLALPDPSTIVFAPNTHEFVRRLLSCLDPRTTPRILTTDSEFHSFARQVARLEEDGLADIVRVPAEPPATFARRFVAELHEGRFDLVFLSHVFFNSGRVVHEIADIVAAVRHDDTLIAIDGYHAFMALPVDLGALAHRIFYLAGGYKYAMAGEGVCFLHCPPGYGLRPRDTGWYAEFGALGAARPNEVAYGADASRFAGATFDPSGLYRFNAVQDWLAGLGAAGRVAAQRAYCAALQAQLVDDLAGTPLRPGQLVVDDGAARGRFLAFLTAEAERIERALAQAGVIVDRRGDVLRIGFGVYQDAADVTRLAAALRAAA